MATIARWRWVSSAAVVLAVFAGACGGSASSATPIFGTEDTACASVSTRNEEGDEELLVRVAECLLEEVQAGRAVTVDVAILSVEGDPIYHRYEFDGERVLIVEDNRADEFGRPNVVARSCARLEADRFLPEGVDCVNATHPGFPEAVR